MTLAILGGTPAFKDKKHVGQPSVPDKAEFMEAVLRILNSHRYTNDGPVVQAFEDRIREWLGVKECVAVVNATAGLEMLAHLLDGPQREIIMPSFTFIATPHATKWVGAHPVFADIDPLTHCLDPASVEARITNATAAICGVHTWGNPCAIDELTTIAEDHGLPLYFDAAHAFLCSHKGRMIGNFGQAEVFSFHATKFLHSFEGGAITTNDSYLALNLRRMRNFGYEDYVIHGLGINAKMTEICAAMGLVNLAHITELMGHNYDVYCCYNIGLSRIEGIALASPYSLPYRQYYNHQYYIVEVDEQETGLSRDRIVEALWQENILARTYFSPPCHVVRPYSSRVGSLPVTEALAKRVIALPSGPMVSTEDASRICNVLAEIEANNEAIRGLA